MGLQSVDVVILPDGRMDRKNAARYLGLAPKTLAMHASRGTGPIFVKRGRVFYFRDDLDDWLKDAPGGRPRSRPGAWGHGPHTSKKSRQRRQGA